MQQFRGVALKNCSLLYLVWGQYFKYKRDKILRIAMESEFPGKCTSTLRVLNIDKVAAWGIIIPLINSAMK